MGKRKKKRKKNQIQNKPKPKWIPYQEYLRTSHWRRRRKTKINNAGGVCQQCGTNKNLQVHHLHYKSLWAEKDKDLEVLCGECHALRHEIDEQARRHLNAIAFFYVE